MQARREDLAAAVSKIPSIAAPRVRSVREIGPGRPSASRPNNAPTADKAGSAALVFLDIASPSGGQQAA